MEKINNKIIFSNEEVENIIDMYSNKQMSILSIIKNLGYTVDSSVIKRILKNKGISIRDNNYYKKKYFNNHYFDKIETEEQAYILGFIYADGYISSNTFGVKVDTKDIDIIEKIKSALQSEHKIVRGINRNNTASGENTEYVMLSINDSYFVSKLQELGVLYNKSKILTFPHFLDKSLIRHFLRGYFDGDGSVYITQNNPKFSLVGTKEFLETALTYIKENVNTKSNIHKNKTIYDIQIGGRNLIKQVYKYLYEDATIYLNRKYLKFKDLI